MFTVVWNVFDWGEDLQESRSFTTMEEADAFFQSLINREVITSVYLFHSSTIVRVYEK